LTRPTFGKRATGYIRWVVQRPELYSEPLAFLYRIMRWKLITLIHKEPTIVFDGNITMKSPYRNVSASSTYQLGYAEPALFSFLSCYLRQGMTFCDVGANVGAYTLFAAKRVGKEGRVVAFEPAPSIYDHLIYNIDANGFANVEPYNIALGEQNGYIAFTYETNDLGKSHVAPNHQLGNIAVNMRTLDDFAREMNIQRVDYIKIDTEGFERSVIMGAKSLIANNKKALIQTEILPHIAQRYGSPRDGLVEILTMLGFIPHYVDEDTLELRGFASDVAIVGDVIWVHRSNRHVLGDFVGA
jgi:FkbM family methyltransferase